jgi:ACS family glucarate transporter-like MFS transporter
MAKSLPYRHRVLILLFFLILITYLDRVCISLVGVRIKSEFHLTNTQFGWVLGAFSLAYALFEIPSGIWGDRIGQRKVFLRIVIWWSLFTALTGATTGFMSLIITRFLFGMGESGAFPNSTGTVSRWLPGSEISKGISAMQIGANAGAAIAPLIIIPIAAAFGWRAPFYVNAGIGLLWVLVCYLWFRNDPAEMKNISNAELKMIERERKFLKEKDRFPFKRALNSRSLWALSISFYCSQFGLYFFVAWMPIYLQEGRHFLENDMKIITSNLFIVGILGAFLGGYVGDWLVKRSNLLFGRRFIGVCSLGMTAILVFIAATSSHTYIVLTALFLANFFLWPDFITSFSTCIDIGGRHAGSIAGIMNFFGQIGSFSLAILFGALVDKTHNFNIPLYVLVFVLALGAFVWLFVNPNQKMNYDESYSKPAELKQK